MPSRLRREQLKAAREASVASFKKRRSDRSPLPNSAELGIDSKLITTDRSDTQDVPGARLLNESANKRILEEEEEGSGEEDKVDLEGEQSSGTERAGSAEARKMGLKRNREGENKLGRDYGYGSRSSRKRQKKAARELKKERAKSYLQQQSHNLSLAPAATIDGGSDQPSELLPVDGVSPICRVSEESSAADAPPPPLPKPHGPQKSTSRRTKGSKANPT